MSSFLRTAVIVVSLAALSTSCVLAFDTSDKHKKQPTTELAAGEAAPAGDAADPTKAEGGKTASTAEASAKKAARKAEKKARELQYSRMELALAEMDAENDLRDANNDLEHARHELEAAQKELDHFQKATRPLELEDAQIDFDRSNESAIERKAELDELASMYKKEEVAKQTKEMVLQRGKFAMEVAQRELDLLKKRQADKKDHELSVKERELTLARDKAQQGVLSAESKVKKTQAHNELELLRARNKVADAERPDDEDEGSKGE